MFHVTGPASALGEAASGGPGGSLDASIVPKDVQIEGSRAIALFA